MRQGLGIRHWVGTGALILLPTAWRIILAKWDRDQHRTSNVMQNPFSDITAVLSRPMHLTPKPWLIARHHDICRIMLQIRSPSATRASQPPPLPENRLEAEEEPGACWLILKATKALSLLPPSALLHVVVPTSSCIFPETPILSMAW